MLVSCLVCFVAARADRSCAGLTPPPPPSLQARAMAEDRAAQPRATPEAASARVVARCREQARACGGEMGL